MKIAFVYPHSEIPTPRPNVSDALAVVTYELTRRLARRHEVVVYPRRGPGEDAESTLEGVTLHRLPVKADNLLSSLKVLDTLGITRRDCPFRLTSLYFRPYAQKVAADIARRRIDVVHIYGIASFIPIIRRANPTIDIVLHSHDHALVDFNRELTLTRIIDTRLILSCSDFVRDNIKARYPEVADRCQTLHNGVDERFFTERRTTPQDEQLVLFIGRLSPEKGVHVLLEAFARVRQRFPKSKLAIVGPDDLAPKQFVDPFRKDPVFDGLESYYATPERYSEFLRRRAGEIGGVEFVGPVPNSDIGKYHAASSIFVFPSIWHEPFGIPLIEAMAAGLPVVATKAGAFPEIVEDGTTGFLVERGDVGELAEAITRLLLDKTARKRMGEAGRQRVAQRFTWDAQADLLLELYARYCPGFRTIACASPL